ncbi:hypothetical protein ABEG10_38260 (plasmid) [Burkholderia cenocepacia]|uniref:hypothetical protein n=1 Tax=Burkholderia cenocepacia TaxID=95486 RepID=UPI0020A0E461|nr:hypothetical protein [Burkholderia cenocepacia]MCO8402768.1 hypothetical protein [Burkholderia cenocepacia]MCO8415104.1 hypothetical protein [Burkholderia cenocepacia]MCO8423097.1 hypothetical protein [Burkholderia cenocepacia]MCO8474754.1 hypothetical protein [Burkholderia cenocepacia]MCO8482066.1 hypothetical protein [Burkholderia cenocepacia]
MTLATMPLKAGGWGRGVVAAPTLIALAAVDRGLSALWPASYGLYHPLAAIGVVASLPLVVYLITRR